MRQVLPVVGAIVGAYIGSFSGNTAQGAQIGWAIGSMVGNAIDPLVIKGPSIGDIAQQTSQEGIPRPIIFGLSQPISGNIVACSQPKIVTKRQRSGKGGGPVTESKLIYRTYAIGVAEGPMPPTWLVRAWSNGKLVYDARPGHSISNNSKFLQDTRLFSGSFAQMPSADLEAIFGANTPAMRGTAYIVRVNIDLTSAGGAVEQMVFQVLRCGGELLTSRPYAQLDEDEMIVGVAPLGGALNLTYYNLIQDPDKAMIGVEPQGGTLRSLLQAYKSLPDVFTQGVEPQSGSLRAIMKKYSSGPELIQSVVTPQSGNLATIVIKYTNPIDELGSSVIPQGGTLS